MDVLLLKQIDKLNHYLHHSSIYKKMVRMEKKMLKDKNVKLLVDEKNIANKSYNEYIKFHSKDDDKAKDLMKTLSNSKEKLYKNKIVRKYLKYYTKYRNLLDEINRILFSDFKVNLCTKNKQFEL